MNNIPKKVGMVSLGCDKNRVDTENVLYALTERGYQLTQNVAEADILVVNTCAFITTAVRESIDTILELAEEKNNRDVKLVVMGCFAERYAMEVKDDLPEVDAFIGVNSYANVADIFDNLDNGKQIVLEKNPCGYLRGRVQTTPSHYAYLKIADGCDNFCTYCAIPYIRGRYRSYPMEDLIEEAKGLADNGVKELIIVAQDTTRYGKDLYGKYMLIELLKELVKLDFYKIRILYAYPELVSDELIDFIANEPKIAKYLDIPLQHISNNVLKAMHRRNTKEEAYELLTKLKDKCPDIAIRSTFIVGFPGETEEDYNQVKELVGAGLIDYAGFFAYSKEKGTLAYKMKNQVPYKVKKAREKELSKMQSYNIEARHNEYVGKTFEVIYEGIDYNKGKFYGRPEYNAPDIDTKVYFTSDFPLEVGEIYNVKITKGGFNPQGETVNE
ncbi:MAG: 30S ribosomal protein S12 methylthiotransferase RimO [Clostridia bacterium]|nr:30S ribosomal protein S12 methylthiotransferase RimO [Clostridia bacterium]